MKLYINLKDSGPLTIIVHVKNYRPSGTRTFPTVFFLLMITTSCLLSPLPISNEKFLVYLYYQSHLKKSEKGKESHFELGNVRVSDSIMYLGKRSGLAPFHYSPLYPNPCSHRLTDNIPEPIPSMYTRHAAWTKDVTVEMVSVLFKAASSPIVFMKLTQDRMSLILTTHLRPNSWWVSQSMKSSITSAMSAPMTQGSKCLPFTNTPNQGGYYSLGPTDGLK